MQGGNQWCPSSILSYMAYFTKLYLNLNLYCDNGYFSSSNSEFWLKKRISNLFIYHAITNTHIHFCMPTYTFKLFNVASFLLVTVKYSPPTISLLMKLFCSQTQNIFTFPKFKNIDISIRWCCIFNLVRHLNAKSITYAVKRLGYRVWSLKTLML